MVSTSKWTHRETIFYIFLYWNNRFLVACDWIFLYLYIFPLHDFWSIVTKEIGKSNWILVYCPRTGSLERRWDHNYCQYKRQASRIKVLLVTFLHQSITPHIQRYHIKAANKETSLHWRIHILFQEWIAATEDSWKCLHRCRRKKKSRQIGKEFKG